MDTERWLIIWMKYRQANEERKKEQKKWRFKGRQKDDIWERKRLWMDARSESYSKFTHARAHTHIHAHTQTNKKKERKKTKRTVFSISHVRKAKDKNIKPKSRDLNLKLNKQPTKQTGFWMEYTTFYMCFLFHFPLAKLLQNVFACDSEDMILDSGLRDLISGV